MTSLLHLNPCYQCNNCYFFKFISPITATTKQVNVREDRFRKTRMHSSRMRAARSLTIFRERGVSTQEGVCPGGACLGGVCPGGVPCDLSHHAFGVTCMLSCHQLRLITSAAAFIVFGRVVMCKNITFTNFVSGQ